MRGLLLSIVVSGEKKIIDYAYNIPELVKYVDWIGVMTYDYYTHYDGTLRTGHIAPLYTSGKIDRPHAHIHMYLPLITFHFRWTQC